MRAVGKGGSDPSFVATQGRCGVNLRPRVCSPVPPAPQAAQFAASPSSRCLLWC